MTTKRRTSTTTKRADNSFGSQTGVMVTPRFQLGRTFLTSGVADRAEYNPDFATLVYQSLRRHARGDWGDISQADNPPCVRPDHLFLGTQTVNLEDMTAKGHRRYRSHAGEDNGRAKLTLIQVQEIRQRFAKGELRSVLAKEYNVCWSMVDDIVKGKKWRVSEQPADEKLKAVRAEVLAMASSMVYVLRMRVLASERERGNVPEAKNHEAKATEIWGSMDKNQRAGVRVGMFPAGIMQGAGKEGYDEHKLCVALMQCAKQDGGMIA